MLGGSRNTLAAPELAIVKETADPDWSTLSASGPTVCMVRLTATDDTAIAELEMWCTAVDAGGPRVVLRVPSTPLS